MRHMRATYIDMTKGFSGETETWACPGCVAQGKNRVFILPIREEGMLLVNPRTGESARGMMAKRVSKCPLCGFDRKEAAQVRTKRPEQASLTIGHLAPVMGSYLDAKEDEAEALAKQKRVEEQYAGWKARKDAERERADAEWRRRNAERKLKQGK